MCEVRKIEYLIRRYQNAIAFLRKYKDYQPKYNDKDMIRNILVINHAEKIIVLKKQLLTLTGRCSPASPKWPL